MQKRTAIVTQLKCVCVYVYNFTGFKNEKSYAEAKKKKKENTKHKKKKKTQKKSLQEVLRIWPLALKESIFEPNVLSSQSSFSFSLTKKFKCFQK